MSASPSSVTFAALGLERLDVLWRGQMRQECPSSVRDLFREMLGATGDRVPDAPAWPSGLTDDCTPFRFSVVFGGPSPEIQLHVEPLGAPPSLTSNAAAGLALTHALSAHGADLSAFERVRDLFLPDSPSGRFAIWHAAVVGVDRAPSFRVYLDPHARGEERSYALVEEALARLGLDHGWPAVAAAARRRPPRDDLRYFCLDLSANPRVELRLDHHDVSMTDLDGGAAQLCEALAGGRLSGVTPATCLTLAPGRPAQVSSVAYLPLRAAVESDRVARDRLRALMKQVGVPAEPYDRALEAFAHRPLEAGGGLHAGVSLERGAEGPRVCVHFAPEAFRCLPDVAPKTTSMRLHPPEEIVDIYERHSIANHPFLQRLRRNPIDPAVLWKLVVNIRAGIALHFSRRLAHVLARMDDLRIRSILAKQLNDELGDGDASRAHILLFDRLIAGLDVYRPAELPAELLAPGEEWSRRLEDIYSQRDAYEGVGAAMVIEIIGRQADCFIGDEFRRQEIVPKAALEWLDLHEMLEQEHSSESLDLARLVPHEGEALAAAWRGARDCGTCCWAFADGMYQLCYGG